MPKINILNTESFSKIRKKNYYYIDKTAFLEKFLRTPDDATLFTRPRRFGKTLFMSMLAEFFDITKDSRELFVGLKVSANEELCKEWMNKYPVISLSLKDVDKPTYARALTDFQELISEYCRKYRALLTSDRVDDEDKKDLQKYIGRTANEDSLRRSLRVISRILCQHYDRPAIVLIDEYDAPVAKAAENGYYREMIGFMRDFLSSALKTNTDNLLFAVLTGCLRVTGESLFSDLNNLSCYGISDTQYADIFGFTQAEVDTLLADAGITSRRENIKTWYDGYCFGKNQEIYCPWSIMNYVDDVQDDLDARPEAYWLHVSSNAQIRRFIRNKTPLVERELEKLLSGCAITKKINVTLNYNEVENDKENLWSLLYMAGFLTKASEEQTRLSGLIPNPDKDEMALVIPNREIHKIFAMEVTNWFWDIVGGQEEEKKLTQALWEGDSETLVQLLEGILLKNISCRDLTKEKAQESIEETTWRENYYHGLMSGYCLACYPETYSNLEAGEGFYDIQVIDKARGRAFIMEIKRAADEKENLADLVAEGLGQIEKNKYDVRLVSDPSLSVVLHWSIAFFKKSCQARAIVVKG